MEKTASFLTWFRKHYHDFAGILFDIDGTIIRKRTPIEGALETLGFVNDMQFPYIFLTNDAYHAHQEKSHFLRTAGLPVMPEHIVSSGDALELLVQQHQLQGDMFFIMGKLGNPDYAEHAGLKISRDLSALQDCRGVIIGEGHYEWEPTFNAVLNYFIKQQEGLLIVPNPDYYFMDQHKDIHIAPGGKANFLCTMLEKCGVLLEPIYLGKPHPVIFDYALKTMSQHYHLVKQIQPQKFLMLGDSLTSDILGANRFGLTSCLMFTGVTSQHMLARLSQDSQQFPTYLFESL